MSGPASLPAPPSLVIPAKAGIHCLARSSWIPAFAGMTDALCRVRNQERGVASSRPWRGCPARHPCRAFSLVSRPPMGPASAEPSAKVIRHDLLGLLQEVALHEV